MVSYSNHTLSFVFVAVFLRRFHLPFAFPLVFTRISSPRGDPRPSKACHAPPPPHTTMWHCRTAAAAAAPRAPPHTLSHYSHTCAPSLPRAAHPVLCWRPCPSPHTTSLQLCGAPTALLAPPPALLHHEPCHVCTSWLHSALRTTRVPLAPRFTATPTAARTLGPGRQVVSPRGLATWP